MAITALYTNMSYSSCKRVMTLEPSRGHSSQNFVQMPDMNTVTVLENQQKHAIVFHKYLKAPG